MDLFFRPGVVFARCKVPTFHLACSFLFGLVLGCVSFFITSDSFLLWMRGADYRCMSIVGLLLVLLLPFLSSAFAVYIHQRWLLFPISFLKAFSFAFLYTGFGCAYPGSGWLIRYFVMFSDILTLPLLWLFWIRTLRGSDRLFSKETVLTLAVAVCVGYFDFTIVSPFAAQLIL